MSIQWVLLHPPPGGVGDPGDEPIRGGWSNLRLKVIGLVLLAMACFSRSVLFPAFVGKAAIDISLWPLTAALALEVISWAAMPIYAWLLVQGFRHTASVGRYFGRLLVLALICEVPYDMVNAWKPFDFGSQNPVFGLALCLALLWALQRLEGRRDVAAVVLRVLMVAAGLVYMMALHIDQHQTIIFGGVILLGFTLIFNYLDKRENTMIMAGTFWGILGAMFPSLGLLAIHRRNEQRGYQQPWVAWVFYAAYPVLLTVFALPHI